MPAEVSDVEDVPPVGDDEVDGGVRQERFDVGHGHRPEPVDVAELAGERVPPLQGGAVDAHDQLHVGPDRLPLRALQVSETREFDVR